ncbi:PREDICTED: uncharacterized protein LOC109126401 [Camelina sativa]|uniref:Uncharacterized protein LOC109126401 n=1 Tax=Camelina sativa TaxID=90675 RepID=A0ABM1QFD5_CAMSA|nr:PREDICTED: uncharacterized protein LOC109126401 [Camelina sativa]
MWNLWTARNSLLFEDRHFSAKEVYVKTVTEARIWQNAQLDIHKPSPLRPPPQVPPSSPLETFTCHVDAAWNPDTGLSGAGWIIKDPSGFPLSQSSSSRPFVPSALVAEALAIPSAMLDITSIAHSIPIRSLLIFSDSQVLIKLLKTDGCLKELKSVLHDIFCLSNAFTSICFNFIPRSNNSEADALAKSALWSASSVVSSPICGVGLCYFF